MTTSHRSAFIGLLLLVPFVVMNFIVAVKPEPIYSFIGSIGFLSAEPWPVLILIALILVGAIVAALPIIRERKMYILNVIVALILLGIFLFLAFALGEEIYRCDALGIANCD